MEPKIMYRLCHLIFKTILKSNSIGSIIFQIKELRQRKAKLLVQSQIIVSNKAVKSMSSEFEALQECL